MIYPTIGVLVTTYNDPAHIINPCLRSIYEQDYPDLKIIVVDDGSNVPVTNVINFEYDRERMDTLLLPHGERAVARDAGLSWLRSHGAEYFLFLDSDMVLEAGLISKALDLTAKGGYDALVVPERAFSNHKNFWSQVKVFERNLYAVGDTVDSSSIEAARFWNSKSFPGFIHGLNAFEEIQPTIKCIERGGTVGKLSSSYILHDEKEVTTDNLFGKKTYYFGEMGSSDKVRFGDMLKKYYFFRRQLYHPTNLLKYLRHPILALATVGMYLALTAIAVRTMAKKKLSPRAD